MIRKILGETVAVISVAILMYIMLMIDAELIHEIMIKMRDS